MIPILPKNKARLRLVKRAKQILEGQGYIVFSVEELSKLLTSIRIQTAEWVKGEVFRRLDDLEKGPARRS